MILFQYLKGETIAFCKIFIELWNFQNPYRENWNLWGVRYIRLKVIFSYVGPDLESSLLQLKSS